MQSRFVVNRIDFGRPWRQADRWLDQLFEALIRAGFGFGAFEVETPGGRKSQSPIDFSKVKLKLKNGKPGPYVFRSVVEGGEVIDFYDYGQMLNMIIDCRLSQNNPPSLNTIVQLAIDLNNSVNGLGMIGPVFNLSLPGLKYPRPLPPRKSAQWPPNVLVYFLSRTYYESGTPAVSRETFELLRRESLPTGAIRREVGDLLIIQATDQLTEEAKLKQQLSALERWIGRVLDLPRDEDFSAEGDQLWRVYRSDRVKPFSFYDEPTKTAYKVVAETGENKLDEETRSELGEILKLRQLPDGRPIKSTMVIFAFPDGAKANLELIRELGGSGVLYRDSEGDFWNPDPPGDWIRETHPKS
jgi:hypothetical protein